MKTKNLGLNKTNLDANIDLDKLFNENAEILDNFAGEQKKVRMNMNTFRYFSEWLGTQEEFDLADKYMGRRYSIYSQVGELLTQHYYRNLKPTDYFDSRLSLYLGYDDEFNLIYWNTSNDLMPIKYEGKIRIIDEIQGVYKIWGDGDETTDVEFDNYHIGAYQLYLNRSNDINANVEVVKETLKKYGNDWTFADERELLRTCNSELVNKTRLRQFGDAKFTPVILEKRTIKMTIHFSCLVNKEGIHIGPGYENLLPMTMFLTDFITERFDIITTEDSIEFINKVDSNSVSSQSSKTSIISKYSFSTIVSGNINSSVTPAFLLRFDTQNSNPNKVSMEIPFSPKKIEKIIDIDEADRRINFYPNVQGITKNTVKYKQLILTQTDQPVHFIRTQIPNGKISLLTQATSFTHSFVIEGKSCIGNKEGHAHRVYFMALAGVNEAYYGTSIFNKRFKAIVSKDFQNTTYSDGTSVVGGFQGRGNNAEGVIRVGEGNWNLASQSVSRFVCYKGNLTEEELKTELNKTLILSEEFNQIRKFM